MLTLSEMLTEQREHSGGQGKKPDKPLDLLVKIRERSAEFQNGVRDTFSPERELYTLGCRIENKKPTKKGTKNEKDREIRAEYMRLVTVGETFAFDNENA